MKQFSYIPFVLAFLFACSTKKADSENNMAAFSMQEFVAIIRDNNFMKFMTLANKPGYELDSSFREQNLILYSAYDTTSDDGDDLSAHTTKDRYINFLSFSTSDKKLYQKLEKQVSEMGFKRLDDHPFVKEFTLDKVHLTIIIEDDKKPPFYTFALVRDERKNLLK